MNRVARQLTDGDESNGEADVIVAEYHEGAASNEDDATAKPTIDEQKAASPVFKKIVDDTDPAVDVIFTAHTHMKYSYTDPAHNGRPVIQTGSYAANIGQVVLDYDKATGTVTYRKSGNVAVDTSKSDDELAAAGDDTVRNVKSIVDAAVAKGQEEGDKPVVSIAADITTAFKDGARDDRASESTMGNLVADSLLDSLSSEDRGGAEIGVVNPGGLRAEFCKTGDNEKCTIAADGTITYAQANAVLPFLNNLWTTTLTGAQFKEALEQQWQTDADGNVPSRPYLQLGLSHNVSYTYDPNAAQGNHITSVTVNGKPLDLKREYRIGSFSFLLQGGDNFRAFAAGKDTKDTGLVDRDAWIDYISKNSPLAALRPSRGGRHRHPGRWQGHGRHLVRSAVLEAHAHLAGRARRDQAGRHDRRHRGRLRGRQGRRHRHIAGRGSRRAAGWRGDVHRQGRDQRHNRDAAADRRRRHLDRTAARQARAAWSDEARYGR